MHSCLIFAFLLGFCGLWPASTVAQPTGKSGPAAFQVKYYPTSLFRSEVRLGLERQTDSLRSLEVAASYFFGAKVREDCHSYCIPILSFSRYPARGGGIMVSRSNFTNRKTEALSGTFVRYSVLYRHIVVDDSRIGAFSTLPTQNHIGLQLLLGKQVIQNNVSASVFGGLGVYNSWSKAKKRIVYSSNRTSDMIPQILLGFSLGVGN